MLKAEQIPPESLGEMVRTLSDTGSYAKALAAAINAWPGAFQTTTQINRDATDVLILPLPKEKLE